MKTPTASDGFTLIEVLVALAILAVSLTVLLAVFSQLLGRAREDDRRLLARTLAQSLLAEAQSGAVPEASGQTPSGLSWQIHREPYGTPDAIASGPQAAVVTATVSWRDGDRERSLTLTTLRIMQRTDRP